MNETAKLSLIQKIICWLLSMLDIDYVQWRALVRASIKRDFRSSVNFMAQQKKSNMGPLMAMIVMFVFMSLFFSIIIGFGAAVPFLTLNVFLTYVTFMIGMMILIDFSAIVVSPDDYEILSYRPVSSKTYMAVKIANLLFYVGVLTVAAGFAPWVTVALIQGPKPLAFVAAALATFGCTFSISLLMTLFYTSILKYVHPRKLQRALSYLQLLMSFVIFGGNIFIPKLMPMLKGVDIDRLPWMFYPIAWFVGVVELSLGEMDFVQIASTFLAAATLVVLFWLALGKLSMSYSERLAVMLDASEDVQPKQAKARPTNQRRFFFSKGESRAVALLIRNHFRYDNKFRMGVLGILPLFVFYIFLAFQEGGMQNPFAVDKPFAVSPRMFVYMAYFMFPVILKVSLVNSESWEASWIYFTSPTNYRSAIAAARNYILFYFMLPFTALNAIALFWSVPNPIHVFLHSAFLFLIAWLNLQLADLMQPALPFSQEHRKGERSYKLMILMFFAPILAMAGLPLAFYYVYSNVYILLLTLAGLGAAVAALEGLLHVRLRSFNRPAYSGTGG